jgi:site-specific recombinase XerD
MAVTDLVPYREERPLSRAGESAAVICDAWSSEPKGQRFAEALVTFLGSKTNPGTQRVYAIALFEFFAWLRRARGTMPLPNQVMRSDVARYVKWLEERDEGLDEDRMELEGGKELDVAILRFVRAHPNAQIGAIRKHLLANDLFACDVTFTQKGSEHTTRSLKLEADVPRGDELARHVAAHGSRPPEPLDVKLAGMCSQNFLRRSPSVAEIRSGKVDLKLDKPSQAQIGYRVDPTVFRYSVAPKTTAKGGDRASGIVNKLSVLSAFWSWLIRSSAENVEGHGALLTVNIWREPIKALRPKAINRRKHHREVSVPNLDLLSRVLATTYRVSHGKDAERVARAALEGVELEDAAIADAPLVDLRDRAILLFFFWCGVRAEELGTIRRRDIDLDTGLVTTTGKGDLVRSFRVPMPALHAVRSFLEVVDAAHVAKPETLRGLLQSEDAPLFPPLRLWGRATRGTATSASEVEGITRSALGRLLRDRAEAAGIPRTDPDFARMHPHGLRHLAALSAVKRGVDVATVQATLGHRSLATTGIYLEVRDPMQRSLQPEEKIPARQP